MVNLPKQRTTFRGECCRHRPHKVTQQGEVEAVKLVRVSVQEMGGRNFGVTLDEAKNKVKDLKRAVEEQEGFAAWTQQLFRFGGGGEGGSAAPLSNSVAVSDEERFALCVDSTLGRCVLWTCGFDRSFYDNSFQMHGTLHHLCFHLI